MQAGSRISNWWRRAIREAVSEAEQQLGIRITEAYAGISGDFACAR